MCHAALLVQCATKVAVTAVNEEMLPSDVRGLTGEKENDHSRNLLRPRHSFSERDFRNYPPKLFLRIRKAIQPLPLKRRHDLSGDDGIHPDTIGKQFGA